MPINCMVVGNMKKLMICVCSLAMVGTTASISLADDVATRKAIEKQYGKIDAAVKARNLKPLDKVVSPDFTVKTQQGQVVTWQQLKANIGLQLSFLQKVTDASVKISKYSAKGQEAKLDVTQSFSGVIADPQTQGKVHTIVSSTQSKDTWVKSGDTWLRKHSDIVSTKMSMDGKKVDLGALFTGSGGETGTPPGAGATKQ